MSHTILTLAGNNIAARGVKVVMSTHDLGQAKRIAGDIMLLHRGRLIENIAAFEIRHLLRRLDTGFNTSKVSQTISTPILSDDGIV